MTTAGQGRQCDTVRGGIQRVRDGSPGMAWEWVRVSSHTVRFVRLSLGRPIWWRPNASRTRHHDITECRAGWLLVAVQVAYRPTAHPNHPPAAAAAAGADTSPRRTR